MQCGLSGNSGLLSFVLTQYATQEQALDALDSLRALALCGLVWWEAYQEGLEVSML